MRLFKKLSFIIFCFSMTLILAGCDFLEEDSTNSSTNNNTNSSIYYINDVAKNKSGVEFTITNVTDTQKIGYNSTENNYIVVSIKISNKGNEPWSQNPNNCVLLLNGAEYEYSSSTYSLDDGMSSFEEINPNITKTMSIAFETPSKSTTDVYSIKISDNSLWSTDIVTIVLTKNTNNV